MEQRSSTDSLSLKERIRSLGFDPEQLTIDEQVELLTLHLALPSDSRSGIGAPAAGIGDQTDQSAARTQQPDARADAALRAFEANPIR